MIVLRKETVNPGKIMPEASNTETRVTLPPEERITIADTEPDYPDLTGQLTSTEKMRKDKPNVSSNHARISRRGFLLRALAAIGLGKWFITRQTGGQLEPNNPSEGWISQHGSPAEKLGQAAGQKIDNTAGSDNLTRTVKKSQEEIQARDATNPPRSPRN